MRDPETDYSHFVGGGQELVVGREDDGRDAGGMAAKTVNLLASVQPPNPDSLVPATGSQNLSVAAEGNACHPTLMARQAKDFFSCSCFPDVNDVIIAASGEELTVLRENDLLVAEAVAKPESSKPLQGVSREEDPHNDQRRSFVSPETQGSVFFSRRCQTLQGQSSKVAN